MGFEKQVASIVRHVAETHLIKTGNWDASFRYHDIQSSGQIGIDVVCLFARYPAMLITRKQAADFFGVMGNANDHNRYSRVVTREVRPFEIRLSKIDLVTCFKDQ